MRARKQKADCKFVGRSRKPASFRSRVEMSRTQHQVTVVPMGMSGNKKESSNRTRVNYSHVAKAVENSDLNSQEETGHITGVHFRDYTIIVEKICGNKYRGRDTFGWTVWIKPKPRAV